MHVEYGISRTASRPPRPAPRCRVQAGACLGLVYSSAESLCAAVRCGRGVFWSRSRGGLWRKGDSSGAWQVRHPVSMDDTAPPLCRPSSAAPARPLRCSRAGSHAARSQTCLLARVHPQTLHRIGRDCDHDALRFTVTQHGEPPAFCHKNSLTCWGEAGGLRALQAVLNTRKRDAPAGSYTKRLFDDAGLLRNKLVEEAQELAEAEEPDHVASELRPPRMPLAATPLATRPRSPTRDVPCRLRIRSLSSPVVRDRHCDASDSKPRLENRLETFGCRRRARQPLLRMARPPTTNPLRRHRRPT